MYNFEFTSTVDVAEIGESPDVAKAYSKSNARQHEVKLVTPVAPGNLVLLIHSFHCEVGLGGQLRGQSRMVAIARYSPLRVECTQENAGKNNEKNKLTKTKQQITKL